MIDSRHFTVEQLAEGVFAAIHRPGGWAVANAGIVDLGEFTLIYDTFLTLQAGKDLRMAAQNLTGSPVRIVINSHYHNDHIWGNQTFGPDSMVISSAETQQLITTLGKEEYDWYLKNSATEFKDLQAKYEAEDDEVKKAELAKWMSYYQGIA